MATGVTDAEKIIYGVVEWKSLEVAADNHTSLVAREVLKEGYGHALAYRYSLVDGTALVYDVEGDKWGFGIHRDLLDLAQSILDESHSDPGKPTPVARFVIPNEFDELQRFHQQSAIVQPDCCTSDRLELSSGNKG